MKIVDVASLPAEGSAGSSLCSIFTEDITPHSSLRFGTATIEPGARVPAEGMSCHTGDEYSYIMKGSLVCTSGGEPGSLHAGQASFIPAQEQHWSRNESDQPCELLWVLVEK